MLEYKQQAYLPPASQHSLSQFRSILFRVLATFLL